MGVGDVVCRLQSPWATTRTIGDVHKRLIGHGGGGFCSEYRDRRGC